MCEIKIRNAGTVVDEFTIEILGDAAPWVEVVPSLLHLFPGTEGAVQLKARPPRQPSTRAGPMPLGLKVVSREDPQSSLIDHGGLDIAAYSEMTAQLVPRTSETKQSAEHTLTVANQGNARIGVSLAAGDPDNKLAFETAPAALEIDPGGSASSTIRVQARRRMLTGRAEPRPFQVGVQAGGEPPINVEGTLLQKPLIPWWVLLVLGALALLGVVWEKTRWWVVILAIAAGIGAYVKRSRKLRQKAAQIPGPPQPPAPQQPPGPPPT